MPAQYTQSTSNLTGVITLRCVSVSGIGAGVRETRLDTQTFTEVDLETGRIVTRLEFDGGLHLVDLLTPPRSASILGRTIDPAGRLEELEKR